MWKCADVITVYQRLLNAFRINSRKWTPHTEAKSTLRLSMATWRFYRFLNGKWAVWSFIYSYSGPYCSQTTEGQPWWFNNHRLRAALRQKSVQIVSRPQFSWFCWNIQIRRLVWLLYLMCWTGICLDATTVDVKILSQMALKIKR